MNNFIETNPDARHEASSEEARVEELDASLTGPARERLASVIYGDIVPRLHLLHHNMSAPEAEHAFSRQEIVDFSGTLIDDDGLAVEQYLQKMRDRGHSEEMLFLGLISEAARHLGALWEDDSRTFIEVTIGVARLQRLLCEFNGAFAPAFTDGDRRILLCAPAGERHVFGLDMVACFMRHGAWDVDLQKDCRAQDVADAVAGERFAIVGLTLSAGSGLETLCRVIRAARAASINPAIGVLVGGPLFRANPALAAQVGADATATDAAGARRLANRLLLRQKSNAAGHGRRGWRHHPDLRAPVLTGLHPDAASAG